jgi:2-phosphosulfolactate phosphatase
MRVRLESLIDGAARATGTVVVIDVFRAFTTAAVALSRGAARVVMVESLDRALALRAAGVGDLCIGERGGRKPEGFDFGNSPAAITRADVAGKTLIQTTTNGTAGVNAARHAERVYAGALVTAEATVQAILRASPAVVTVVAMGRAGEARADEDELCALYLRSRLEGRHPDRAALRSLLMTSAPPPNPALVASGDVDPEDRLIATHIDLVGFPVVVDTQDGLLVATAAR